MINIPDPMIGGIVAFLLVFGYIWLLYTTIGFVGASWALATRLSSYLKTKTEAVRWSLLSPAEQATEYAKRADAKAAGEQNFTKRHAAFVVASISIVVVMIIFVVMASHLK
jgi:hypothetical protein